MTVDARRIGIESKGSSLREGDTVTARVRRFTPGEEPRYETFEVPYQKWMRVLDVLIYISDELDSDLSYRWYCGSKMCGSCAMRVNGREILACWAAAEPDMTIEPLRNLPVVRDLTVDRRPYEQRFLELEPWIERAAPYPGFPEPLTHREMKLASRALDCISCAACYSACPVVGLGDVTNFSGPAPLVQIAQAALDPRDSREPRGRPHRAGVDFQLRIVLSLRGGVPGQHSDRLARHRAAEGAGVPQRAQEAAPPARVSRRHPSPRAASIPPSWCYGSKDCAPSPACAASLLF